VFNIHKKASALVISALVMAFCLFAQSSAIPTNSLLCSVFAKMGELFLKPKTQWLVYSCLFCYIAELAFVERRLCGLQFWRMTNRCLWISFCVVFATFAYVFSYPAHTDPPQALILITGIVLGRVAAIWVLCQKLPEREVGRYIILIPLLAFLFWASMPRQINHIQMFSYQGQPRWSGPWNSPNIYGLLMAMGTVLAIGGVVSSLRCQMFGNSRVLNWRIGVKRWGVVLLCLATAGFMGCGLLHSYSRGAWLAILGGLVYLFWPNLQNLESKVQSRRVPRFAKNWLPFSLVLISVFVLLSWHFQQTDWHPVRRAFAVVNADDFSWRNRVAAWEGALQIMAEHPWFGGGWNQPVQLYEHYYLPPKLSESAAIEMNDYLLFGATLGIPALFCFGMYLWLSLMRSAECGVRHGRQRLEVLTLDWLQTTCRAGAIVLLVGFWFDGGLFKLATGSTFWILLELGSVELPQKGTESANEVP
jgi:O-antigen ligase